MQKDNRKAAIAAYKERKACAGIYAIRCTASAQVWVGQTPHLDTIQNRIWFSLRQGSHPNRALQAAWTLHGADTFAFEPLEQLAEEESRYVRDALLKERAGHWQSTLDARAM
ncbi:MAG: GIY-YIG nuclease family protein [Rhodopseudomonas sp.]|uniref:GIY-YIG nuclease family protein n=1 Tax=Rhodopseudomonas sp. TaxID=1078 RepID=UPI001846A77C|nr:GIY-YIG nuclease family protein [Rhodopseudomonas sp.]NVN85684.1 GIY-YIG nuclease family protein [Rhodopseudomonas sp.]